jgi:uncharacterized repeat protein (TIGR01451 family)
MTKLIHRASNKWMLPSRWLYILLAWLLCSPSAFALVITRTSSPIFYIDTSIVPQLQGMYVSYQVSNNDGTSYSDLWVGIDSFSGGVISLGPNEDGLVHLGPLAPGQTKTAFFFLQASGETALPQTHAVRVYPTRPPAAALTSASFSMTSMEAIQANANKVVTVVTGPSPPQLGGIVTMTVTGDAGTLGAARIMSFNPAAYLDWRADAFELISSSITLSVGNTGTYNDQLLIIAGSASATEYVAVYRFRAVSMTTAPTTISPISYISSGSPIKHTTTGNYGSIPPMLPTDNRLTIGKQSSVAGLFGAGTVGFTISATNSGTVEAILEDFVDTLPANPAALSYVGGSSRFNGVSINDPVVSGSTLTWVGTFTLPAGGSRALTFNVSVPGVSGTYTNRAVAHVGNTQVDTTLSTADNAPALATFTVGQLTVSGFVYHDLNRNSQRETTEVGTGLALFAKLVPASNPTGPAVQAVVVTNSSGAYLFPGVSPGTYLIVIDNNNDLADVTPNIPSSWIGTEQPTHMRDNVLVTATDVVNQNFGLMNGTTLTGRSFNDNGVTGGTANDGLINGGEQGLAGNQLRLTDSAGTAIYDSTVSGPSGDFSLFIPGTIAPGTQLKVVEGNASGYISTGGSPGNTGGTYDRATDAITFTFLGTNYQALQFGNVAENNFLNDSQQTGLPGSFVLHSHTFIANSAGQLSFSMVGVPNPSIAGWTPVIYLDANCNAQVEPTEQPIAVPLSVVAGQQVCILIKDSIPPTAPFNAQHQVTITAEFQYTGANPSLSRLFTRTALTVVGNPSSAGLTLAKSVDKQIALPGETLIYTITYSNNSSEALNNIVVFDSTPAFTTFLSAAAGALPANLSSVTISSPGAGNSGPIQWNFTGTLAPGQTGTVTFSVLVSQ